MNMVSIICPYCNENDLCYPVEEEDRVHWTDCDAGIITTYGIKCNKCEKEFTVRIGFIADLEDADYIDPDGCEIEREEE